MDAPWSLFDDDEGEGAGAAAAPQALQAPLPPPLEPFVHLAAVLAAFVSRHAAGATEDLCASGGAALAAHIGALCTASLRLHALLRRGGGGGGGGGAPGAELGAAWAAVGAASQAAAAAAWARLRSPASWPHVAWREALCMALLGQCVHCTACAGDARGAMAALDAALILGAPRAEIEGLVHFTEARAVEAGAGAPPPPPLPSLPPHAAALPAALTLTTPGAWVPRQRVAPSRGAGSCASAPAPGEHPALSALRAALDAPPLTPQAFAASHVAPSRPLVLTNLLAHWPALQRWRHLDYWRAALGHRTVPIERGRALPGGSSSSAWGEELCLFQDFLAADMAQGLGEAGAGGGSGAGAGGGGGAGAGLSAAPSIAYMAQHALFEQCPAFKDKGDYDIPAFLLAQEVGVDAQRVVSNLWMGTSGTVTHAHFDSYENVLGQVAGYKFVRLFPPGERARLQALGAGSAGGSGTAAQGNVSTVDVEGEGFDAEGCLDAILGPGDALYIPVGWWHYVRACTPSISLNMWWTPQGEEGGQ